MAYIFIILNTPNYCLTFFIKGYFSEPNKKIVHNSAGAYKVRELFYYFLIILRALLNYYVVVLSIIIVLMGLGCYDICSHKQSPPCPYLIGLDLFPFSLLVNSQHCRSQWWEDVVYLVTRGQHHPSAWRKKDGGKTHTVYLNIK